MARSIIRTSATLLGAVVLLLLQNGCASVSSKYIPQTIGTADHAEAINGLQISITSSADRITLGKPVTFDAEIRNIGNEAFWVPREPRVIFLWVYANGQRDNFVEEYPNEEYFSRRNAVLLKPGESMTASFTIKTHYFPKPGITEFRAIYYAASNTNPRLKPFWEGRASSNAYGVYVGKPRFGSARKKTTQRAAVATPTSS